MMLKVMMLKVMMLKVMMLKAARGYAPRSQARADRATVSHVQLLRSTSRSLAPVTPLPSISAAAVPQAFRSIVRSAEFTFPSPLRSPGRLHDVQTARAAVAHALSH